MRATITLILLSLLAMTAGADEGTMLPPGEGGKSRENGIPDVYFAFDGDKGRPGGNRLDSCLATKVTASSSLPSPYGAYECPPFITAAHCVADGSAGTLFGMDFAEPVAAVAHHGPKGDVALLVTSGPNCVSGTDHIPAIALCEDMDEATLERRLSEGWRLAGASRRTNRLVPVALSSTAPDDTGGQESTIFVAAIEPTEKKPRTEPNALAGKAGFGKGDSGGSLLLCKTDIVQVAASGVSVSYDDCCLAGVLSAGEALGERASRASSWGIFTVGVALAGVRTMLAGGPGPETKPMSGRRAFVPGRGIDSRSH